MVAAAEEGQEEKALLQFSKEAVVEKACWEKKGAMFLALVAAAAAHLPLLLMVEEGALVCAQKVRHSEGPSLAFSP